MPVGTSEEAIITEKRALVLKIAIMYCGLLCLCVCAKVLVSVHSCNV